MHFRVTSGQFIYMSFGSKVVVARFNRREKRVETMEIFPNSLPLTSVFLVFASQSLDGGQS